jgi:hypothetical protein
MVNKQRNFEGNLAANSKARNLAEAAMKYTCAQCAEGTYNVNCGQQEKENSCALKHLVAILTKE